MEIKNKQINIFKLWGIYAGLFAGLLIALQFKINRMYLLEGARELDCVWKPIKNLSCSDWALLNIILFLLAGFLIGGLIHIKNIK